MIRMAWRYEDGTKAHRPWVKLTSWSLSATMEAIDNWNNVPRKCHHWLEWKDEAALKALVTL